MNELPFPSHGIIKYDNPEEIQRLATEYAIKRIQKNSKLHDDAPEYDRGALATSVDELGITAELIGIGYLKNNGIEFDGIDVFENRPVVEADVFIGETKIDIKGVRVDNQNLTVNRRAHFKKDVTHYWFIKPYRDAEGNLNGEAEYWVISAVYVSLWNVNDTSFTAFFYKEISSV